MSGAKAFSKFTFMIEDMHNLLGKYFSGEATEEEKNAVSNWKLASEKNAEEFRLMENMWLNADLQSHVSFDTDNAWQKVDAKAKVPVQKGKVVNGWMKAAVALAACFILVAGIWWMIGDRTSIETIVADADATQVKLEDGTTVYLIKNSVLTYPRHFTKHTRSVTLSGEGFFDVVPDAARPFTITASETELRVLGTSFSVNTSNSKVELIVKTGRVRFGASADTSNRKLVVAGEKAVFADNQLNVSSNTDLNFNAWQSRQLIFEKTPMNKVVADISKTYNVQIILKKEDEAQLSMALFTDSFNDKPLQEVLEQVERITTYRIEKVGESKYEVSIR